MLNPFVAIQTKIPKMVGINSAAKVHFMLPVSFFMVKSVVEQGQWKREKRIVFMAVRVVQPFAKKSSFISTRERLSVTVPWDKYDIIIIGITISFAGNPRMKARRITPSSPISRANGSKKFEA